MSKKNDELEDKGWTFVAHFGQGEIWKKGKERILIDSDDGHVIHQYTEQ